MTKKIVIAIITTVVFLTIGHFWRVAHVESVKAAMQAEKNGRILWKNY